MLLPALARAKRKAKQVNCSSNLKQVGTGLYMYVSDSDDWLPPGPNANPAWSALDLTQRAGYQDSTSDKRMMPYYLWTYLACPAPVSTATNVCRPFFCPGFEQVLQGNQLDAYMQYYSYSATRTNNLPLLPWYPFGKRPEAGPVKLSAIATVMSLSDCWALADIDQQALDPASSGSASWWPDIPTSPVHGSVRN